MILRTAHRVLVPIAPWLLAGAVLCAGDVTGVGCGVAHAQPATVPPEEKAIQAADDAFVAIYNKGDSKALAALFTEDAEVVELDGPRYQGRDLIERRFADTFAAAPGIKLALEIEGIRFLSPDVAKEEGLSRVTSAQGASEVRRFTVLYVRRGGHWLISSVREETDPLVRPHDRLKELEWMIGQWVDEAPDCVVHLTCQWSEDENFLIRAFTVKLQGKPVMQVTQRIGWDPLARQVRSWEFDSEGGYGEGRWSGGGDRWVVKHTGVRPDGSTASATNIMTRERPDLVRWVSLDRVMGSEPTLDEESYVLVRVAPAPRLDLKGPVLAPSSPAPAPAPAPAPTPAPSRTPNPTPKRSPR
jgi:uncharacterized protein (TIGR02246 family)